MKGDSKNAIISIAGIDSFRCVSNLHPLDLYIGKDISARPTLLLLSDIEPSHIFSSKLIGIHIGKRADDRWALSFSLNDSKLSFITIPSTPSVYEFFTVSFLPLASV